jgi:hypothetical protein
MKKEWSWLSTWMRMRLWKGRYLRHEPSKIEKIVRDDKVAWSYLKEGRFIPFMERIEGYDEMITWKFVNSWKKYWVTINEVPFEVTEELIGNATRLPLEGKSWRKKPRIKDEVSLKSFFHSDEAHVHFTELPKAFRVIHFGDQDDECLIEFL